MLFQMTPCPMCTIVTLSSGIGFLVLVVSSASILLLISTRFQCHVICDNNLWIGSVFFAVVLTDSSLFVRYLQWGISSYNASIVTLSAIMGCMNNLYHQPVLALICYVHDGFCKHMLSQEFSFHVCPHCTA